jgi:hypothetical protein
MRRKPWSLAGRIDAWAMDIGARVEVDMRVQVEIGLYLHSSGDKSKYQHVCTSILPQAIAPDVVFLTRIP